LALPQLPKENMTEFDCILLTSFGGPEASEDVEPFLRNVANGRDIPAERLEEVQAQYGFFGGVSPINQQNRDLIAALEEELQSRNIELPIYFGNRNWDPYISDALQNIYDDGKRNVLALVTSAFGSYSGCRQYQEDLDLAVEGLNAEDLSVEKIRLFWNHPGFFEAMVQRLKSSISEIDNDTIQKTHLAFTAHSIPSAWMETNPYQWQLRDFASQLVDAVAPDMEWDLVFQSRSGPPTVPWLEPDIVDHLDSLSAQGVESVIIAPIGFVSDHMEVMFDLDTEAADHARSLGMKVTRTPTVGVHPTFVSGLGQLIEEKILNQTPLVAFGEPWICQPGCCSVAKRPSSR